MQQRFLTPVLTNFFQPLEKSITAGDTFWPCTALQFLLIADLPVPN
jgi:hypothetical protein